MKPFPLHVAPPALTALVHEVRRHGRRGTETGGFLLTAPGHRDVAVVALAGSDGIERGYGRFVITLPAIDAAFTYAEQRGLQVRAMIHSHPGAAFLSPTDLKYSLRVRGFVNAVIPTFADPPADSAAWGWWQFETTWEPCAPSVADPACPAARVVTFDATGVREAHAH